MSGERKKTPLAAVHEALGAKMIDFGGWWMPVQYTGILKEHEAVRTNVGLFDLSHMGEIEVRGPNARDAVQRLITNDVDTLEDGAALYSPMCLPSGGIVDDLVVYRIDGERYLLVVNAGNIEKDLAWIREHAGDAEVDDRSEETALLAVQGPRAEEALESLTAVDIRSLRFFRFMPEVEIASVTCLLSCSGYTGERGFEIYCPAEDAIRLWEALHEAVTALGGLPVGLGARDTLRLEARLLLYGNDIDETTTPLEAGLGWTVAFEKGDFIGSEALRRQLKEGVARRLVGFRMEGRAIARTGYPVYRGEERVGSVTSGAPSPTLGVNIGLAYVARADAKIGRRIEIEVRRKRHAAQIVRTPFYSAKR